MGLFAAVFGSVFGIYALILFGLRLRNLVKRKSPFEESFDREKDKNSY